MVKGVSLEPWPGNPPPRIVRLPPECSMPSDYRIRGWITSSPTICPGLFDQGVMTIVNIVGKTVEEYAAVAARLDQAPGVAALEVNISCPNVKGRRHCLWHRSLRWRQTL